MSYNRTVWVNDSVPAINAENLNKIENGIETNDNSIGTLSDLNTTEKSNLVGAINDLVSSTLVSKYLGENPDINTLKTSGKYGLYMCSQTPKTSIGVLEVLAYTGDWVVQRFTEVVTGSMWQREFIQGTTWTEWSQKW